MNNQNMSWNQFLTEYMLRAMSNYQIFEEYKVQQMVEFARRAWDAMQAAELPESEKAKQAPIAANSPDLKPSNSMELKEFARTARDVFSEDAQWITIEENGEVWAYVLKPTIDAHRNVWDNIDNIDDNVLTWFIGSVAPPADFTKELYQISKILDNE